MADTERRWMSVKQTADYLNISFRSLYNRTHSKTQNPFPIRPKRLGKKILFDVKEIDEYMESL